MFGQAFSHHEDVLKGSLEEAVAHLISVSVVPGKVLQGDLQLAVAVPLLRRETLHRVLKERKRGESAFEYQIIKKEETPEESRPALSQFL